MWLVVFAVVQTDLFHPSALARSNAPPLGVDKKDEKIYVSMYKAEKISLSGNGLFTLGASEWCE